MLQSNGHIASWRLAGALALATGILTGGCGDPPEPPVPASITVTPATADLEDFEETVQLTATVKDQNGATVTDAEIRWLSSDDVIARVSGSGLVRGKDAGTAYVWAFVERLVDTAVVTVSMGPRGALVRFYNAADGPDWTTSTNWGTSRPLDTWHGVATDAEGNVTGLSLSDNELGGNIASEIGVLEKLERLDLSSNDVTGPIPPEIGKLVNLTRIDFSSTALTGPIPPEIGNLRNLESIDFSSPFLSPGTLTGAIPAELGNLASLTTLDLSGNSLSGSIPPELGGLASLQQITLESNSLRGTIPSEFGNLGSLRSLVTSANPMSGRLPQDLTRLSLRTFHWNGTDLCAPTDDAFKAWLESINDHEGGADCDDG